MKQRNTRESFVIGGWAFAIVFLFLYSYTQVDLSLTLSRVSAWQVIQKSFQFIGFYQRPLSTFLYVSIVSLLYVLYGATIKGALRGWLSRTWLWRIILSTTAILVFSYPAFSYDLFNYMFTAKTVLVYHKNPYAVVPLEFSGVDPWLSFLHWTHLPSAYTPLWIFMTLPAYILGFRMFLLTMFNIKLLVGISYIGAVWALERVMETFDPKNARVSVAVFALNPLVIVEGLVSGHNDMVMMALSMVSLLLFVKRKAWFSWIALVLSIAAKLMTVFLLPSVLFGWNRKIALFGMCLGLLLVMTQREVLPWYFLWIMPFVALFPDNGNIVLVAGGVSLGLLLRYAPFIYFGHWDAPVPLLKLWLTTIPIAVSLARVALVAFPRSRRSS